MSPKLEFLVAERAEGGTRHISMVTYPVYYPGDNVYMGAPRDP